MLAARPGWADELKPPEVVTCPPPPSVPGGSVVGLTLALDERGEVGRVEYPSEHPLGAQAAALAQQCQFRAAYLGEEPVPVTVSFDWVFPAAPTEADPLDTPGELVAQYDLPLRTGSVVMDASAIRLAPGSLGDPIRALQGNPGTTRTPLDAGWPLVHGGDFDHTALLVDGVRTPLLMHLGGFTSVLYPSLVERVSLYPGLAPARFRDALTGAIEVETRPVGGALVGEVGVNTAFAEIFAEAPLPRGGIALGARRSWLDGVLALALGPSAARIAPRFWDLSARWDHGRSHWTVLTFRDALEAPSSTEVGEVVQVSQWATQVQGELSLGDWRVLPWVLHHERAIEGQDQQDVLETSPGVRAERRWGGPVQGQVGVEGGPSRLQRVEELQQRQAVSWRSDLDLKVEAGSGSVRPRLEGRLNSWVPPQGQPQAAFCPQGGLSFAAGAWRADAGLGRSVKSPRSALFLGLPEAEYLQLERTDHLQAALGVSLRDVNAGLMAWTTRSSRLASFEADGTLTGWVGSAAGSDLDLRWVGRSSEVVTLLQLARVLRSSDPAQPGEPWLFEQPVRWETTLRASLPRAWTLGGRWRLSAGLPSPGTLQDGRPLSAYDLLTGETEPLPTTGRLPTWYALDLEVRRGWEGKIPLEATLLLQNLTARRVAEPVLTGFGEAIPGYGKSLPFLPVFGLRATLSRPAPASNAAPTPPAP